MANYFIHVGSITNAMRGRRVLETHGIRAFLQRSAHPADQDGCGYRLLVTIDLHRAIQLLQDNGVRVIRVSDAL